jgi:mannose-1-phosphate guanylyltransferase
MTVVKDSGLTNFSGLIKRKEMRRRRNKIRPKKTKTPLIRPAGRNTAPIMTMRALRLDAIRQKGKILKPSIE